MVAEHHLVILKRDSRNINIPLGILLTNTVSGLLIVDKCMYHNDSSSNFLDDSIYVPKVVNVVTGLVAESPSEFTVRITTR